jgi:dienelactone hydrolase
MATLAAAEPTPAPETVPDPAKLNAADALWMAYADHRQAAVIARSAEKIEPVKSLNDWSRRRRHILLGMQRAMGPFPRNRYRPTDFKTTEAVELAGGFTRLRIEFRSSGNAAAPNVPAYLFIPKMKAGERRPAILCLHQTQNGGKSEPAGLSGLESLHYALELAERGYVTLAPDYPSFGDYHYDFKVEPELASGTLKAVLDNMAAVDLLQARADVDGDRIAAIGHSLGGHNAIYTAVFDTRIQAVVSSCGFNAFHKYYEGNLIGWTSDRYMPRIRTEFGNSPDKVPFDFPELIAALAPRAFFTSSPLRDGNFEVSGVHDCIAAAKPIYELHSVADRLQAVHPDCEHEFPAPIRKQAYEFLDKQLGFTPAN